MAAPNLSGEFNGVASLLMNVLMWIFGMGGQGNGLSDILRKIFGGGSSETPTSTSPTPTPVSTPTSTTTPTPTATPTSTPTASASPTSTNHIITLGDSLADGYGQGLSHEFNGKSGVKIDDFGVKNAGLLAPTHLKDIDWSTVRGATVLISVGTNDVPYLTGKGQGAIDNYAKRVISEVADKVTNNGGTPVIVAMRAPDKPLSWTSTDKDGVKHTHTQTPEEFAAWKDTLAKTNAAIAQAAAAHVPPIRVATQEGGDYVDGGVHQTNAGYQRTADNALKQAGVTVTPSTTIT